MIFNCVSFNACFLPQSSSVFDRCYLRSAPIFEDEDDDVTLNLRVRWDRGHFASRNFSLIVVPGETVPSGDIASAFDQVGLRHLF